jgi:N-acetylglucosaminyldiphosphoundecaprenol N-acetyl-beta-D-mannosaminyltransferase
VSSPEVATPKGTTLILRCGRILLYSLPVADLFCSQTERLKHVVTVNAEIFTCAHENHDMERILSQTLNTIDGRILQWLCALLYPRWKICRLPGSDFIYELAEYSTARSEGILLLGASAESNRLAVEALRARFRGLNVAGYSPPFCSDIRRPDWNQPILRQIEMLHPTHLVVCFGPVKQESWISRNAESLFSMGVRCAYGLGGTLDFVAGTKRRAPKWIQRVGAEWLFRLICEPRQRFFRTMTMFKMPYFVARTPCREIRPVAAADLGLSRTECGSDTEQMTF